MIVCMPCFLCCQLLLRWHEIFAAKQQQQQQKIGTNKRQRKYRSQIWKHQLFIIRRFIDHPTICLKTLLKWVPDFLFYSLVFLFNINRTLNRIYVSQTVKHIQRIRFNLHILYTHIHTNIKKRKKEKEVQIMDVIMCACVCSLFL